ncbi:ABC transporter substrate-binding protein [Nonomuraea sediminis]|uniref:ABC transporter substrate-binding protein n=1 Tax=Nonomuraea sediminis TaxID=2835864 RepID=UPI001BDD1DBE|nr:ABC transporter substrate-binding protein [Nonomuraea sediminis]
MMRPFPRALGAVAGLTLVAVTAACGSSSSDEGKGGPIQITFSYLWGGPEAQALEKIIAEFNAGQKKIVVKGVSSPDFQKQLASMSGSKGAFDISDNFGNGVGSWAAKGILEPLDDYLAKDGVDTSDFVPAALQQMKYEGKTYSLPIAVHSYQLLYNKKLFADAGIDQPPKTTEEWAAAIAKLTKTDGAGNLTQLGLGNPDSGSTFSTLAYQFGGDWFDGSGKATPTNPGNLAALKFYTDNVTAKYGADKVLKFTSGFGEYASPQNPFYIGKVAMVIDGEWQPRFIAQNAPKLEWGVAALPYPSSQPQLEGTTQLTASTLFIPRNSAHKQEAWEFMKFMMDKKAMLDFTYALGNLPSRLSLLDDPKFADIPQFKNWLDALKSKNVKVQASTPWAQQYSTDLNAAFDQVLRGTAAPDKALADVAGKAGSYAR